MAYILRCPFDINTCEKEKHENKAAQRRNLSSEACNRYKNKDWIQGSSVQLLHRLNLFVHLLFETTLPQSFLEKTSIRQVFGTNDSPTNEARVRTKLISLLHFLTIY
jgi:hypothetical protein